MVVTIEDKKIVGGFNGIKVVTMGSIWIYVICHKIDTKGDNLI